MGRTFLQGLSALLTLSLVSQVAFGPLAMAATPAAPSSPYVNDPFWSDKQTAGGQVTPVTPGNLFNNDPGDNGANNDPWGNWTDPNGGNSPFNSGNWGDPSSDPFSAYGGWNSGVYMSKSTDPMFVKLMRATGVLSKDYPAMIESYRQQYSAYGTESDDAIADIIIKKHMYYAGLLGAAAAVMPVGFDALWKDWRQQQSSFGYGVGMALGGLGDFMAIIAQEASMMFELQELYGVLPEDDDDRTASTVIPFILGMGGASLNKLVSGQLRLDVTTTPVTPGPQPGPQPQPNPFAPITPPAAAQPGPAVQVNRAVVSNPLAKQTAELIEWATIKAGLQKWFETKLPNVANKTEVAAHLVATMPPVFKVIASAAISAGISYETNKTSCYYFGQWAKRYYKAMHQVELANVIHQLRSDPEAKAALWVVTLKDVFTNPDMKMDDSEMYAGILEQVMPLIKNSKWDELASIQRDYRAHPDMIDSYLTDLRNDLSTDAKLYLTELLMGGMLMKGGMNYQDNSVLQNFAIALGLYEPPKVNLTSFKPGDQRLIDRERYVQLKDRMQMNVVTAAEATASKLPQNKNYVAAHWGRSGQIIIQDYEDSSVQPMVDLFDRIKANGGLDPSTLNQTNNCADAVAQNSGNPVTNVGNAPATCGGNTPAPAAPPAQGGAPSTQPQTPANSPNSSQPLPNPFAPQSTR